MHAYIRLGVCRAPPRKSPISINFFDKSKLNRETCVFFLVFLTSGSQRTKQQRPTQEGIS